jgi:exodeoxyribonuclease VIII
MKDIMVDLETFGTEVGSMIVSIGAVKFDLTTGHMGEEFYININAESCSKYGLVADGGAVNFWLQQPAEAQLALFKSPRVSLPEGLAEFSKFYGDFRKSNIWGNGCCFDNMLLRAAYKAIGKEEPWGFRNDRDVRTIVQLGKLAGLEKNNQVFEGVKHNALDDAKHQVKYCSAIWKHINED